MTSFFVDPNKISKARRLIEEADELVLRRTILSFSTKQLRRVLQCFVSDVSNAAKLVNSKLAFVDRHEMQKIKTSQAFSSRLSSLKLYHEPICSILDVLIASFSENEQPLAPPSIKSTNSNRRLSFMPDLWCLVFSFLQPKTRANVERISRSFQMCAKRNASHSYLHISSRFLGHVFRRKVDLHRFSCIESLRIDTTNWGGSSSYPEVQVTQILSGLRNLRRLTIRFSHITEKGIMMRLGIWKSYVLSPIELPNICKTLTHLYFECYRARYYPDIVSAANEVVKQKTAEFLRPLRNLKIVEGVNLTGEVETILRTAEENQLAIRIPCRTCGYHSSLGLSQGNNCLYVSQSLRRKTFSSEIFARATNLRTLDLQSRSVFKADLSPLVNLTEFSYYGIIVESISDLAGILGHKSIRKLKLHFHTRSLSRENEPKGTQLWQTHPPLWFIHMDKHRQVELSFHHLENLEFSVSGVRTAFCEAFVNFWVVTLLPSLLNDGDSNLHCLTLSCSPPRRPTHFLTDNELLEKLIRCLCDLSAWTHLGKTGRKNLRMFDLKFGMSVKWSREHLDFLRFFFPCFRKTDRNKRITWNYDDQFWS